MSQNEQIPEQQSASRRVSRAARRRKRALIVLAASLVMVLGIYFGLEALWRAQVGPRQTVANNTGEDPIVLVTGEPEQAQEEWKPPEGARNILLIGLDRRDPSEGDARSDTMILATLDPAAHAIKLTSFMRDMYVEIPGKGKTRINAATAYGGAQLLLDTLEHNFGLQIDSYVAIDFVILADVIDQIGGIVLDVSQESIAGTNISIDEYNRLRGIEPNTHGFLTQSGMQLLSGKQAQAYARCRMYTKDGDFGRIVRQREVLEITLEKLKKRSLPELTQLVSKNIGQVETNMSLADIIALIPTAISLADARVQELRIPQDGAFASQRIRDMAVLVPNLQKNIDALKAFLEAGDS